ncbi:flavin reductase (DIM6/NTAB) family NADH-FMN oxidoreductase RutF [Microbacterium sp. SLBN-154]|uniref:flavin reductase family protein n=1 Tax=Microbacterium sp. SLBN-154 TaxID=2768458 RepID=UPI001150B5D0|nr:flavin reductase family protein [Microbacterium sp. SLBN-154]TQK17712.1 flavin reductase (DIM6/NTAB) family NADH-FMN oxidoreductase RutF [Microbacterium sp. SLBN-154]
MTSDSHQIREHIRLDPAILYFGTPVAVLSTVGNDGAPNLAPMSSVFWLGSTAVLGLGTRSKTAQNLLSTREVVISLPSVDQVDAIDRLALTTGRDPVPDAKAGVGYRFVADKFEWANLTPVPSDTVAPPRVAEFPVALEGRVVAAHGLERAEPTDDGKSAVFEIAVRAVHVHPALRAPGYQDRIDPTRWRPLVMSFQRFFGLSEEVHFSRLARIDEEWYR